MRCGLPCAVLDTRTAVPGDGLPRSSSSLVLRHALAQQPAGALAPATSLALLQTNVVAATFHPLWSAAYANPPSARRRISNPQHDLALKHGEVHEHAGHTTQQLPYPRFFQQSGRRCFGDESGHLYSYSYFIFLLPDSR